MPLRLSHPKAEVKQKVIKTKMNRQVVQHPKQITNTVLIYLYLHLMGGWGRDKEVDGAVDYQLNSAPSVFSASCLVTEYLYLL